MTEHGPRPLIGVSTYREQVTRELRAGEKRSHWMRFVFPQLVGLGSSPTARRYVIVSFDEARAYLRRPVSVRA